MVYLFIVTYLSFALAVFCVIGICAMAYWARTQRRTSIPPSQPPPLPPRPANFAREAIVAISTFAQRRQEERDRSREAFNRRNAEFQRELAERLEAVRIRREAAYPGTPRNTPEPHCSFVATLPRLSREPSLAPTTRQASPAPSVPSRSTTPAPILPPRSITPAPSVPSRSTTPPPTTHRSSSFTSTPTMHRSREATPSLPGIDVSPVPSPAQSEHLYDSPADTIYESIDNSPVDSPPQLPSTPERRSRFGRLLKRPSFFKCMW